VQVSFQFIPFKNEARKDDLRLYHWVQCYKDANGQTRPADDGPYSFAKYNTKVGAYRYDDIEYETVIRPNLPESETGWSKVRHATCHLLHSHVASRHILTAHMQEETDYLLDLCELLDLRFIVIADRWDFPGGPRRNVEDLKEHYYAIAHELAIARAGGKALANSNPVVRQPFDAQKERERKEFLRLTLHRSQQQVWNYHSAPSCDGTVFSTHFETRSMAAWSIRTAAVTWLCLIIRSSVTLSCRQRTKTQLLHRQMQSCRNAKSKQLPGVRKGRHSHILLHSAIQLQSCHSLITMSCRTPHRSLGYTAGVPCLKMLPRCAATVSWTKKSRAHAAVLFTLLRR
jgi:hypothetical protein